MQAQWRKYFLCLGLTASLLTGSGCMMGGGHGGHGGGAGMQEMPGATLTSLSPSTVTAGGPPFVLTVNGSGFVAGGTIFVNGTGFPYNFASSTQVTVAIDGGSIANAGSISIVVTIPTPNTLQSNSLTLTITPHSSQACVLFGLNRFLFTGFDSTGPVTLAGSFGVDSQGNVNGEEDFKDSATVRTAQPITGGTCTNDSTITNQGVLTVSTPAGTSTYTFVLQQGGGGVPRGRLAESGDTTGISGSGIFVESPPDGFFSGDYAFGVVGNDSSGSRMSMIGRFTDSNSGSFDTPGDLGSGLGDINDGGIVTPSTAITGTISVPDVYSRCDTTLEIGSQTLQLVIYVNSSNGGFVMDVDSGSTPLLGGVISAQANSGAYSNGYLSAPVVFSTWGVNPDTPQSSATSVGIASGFDPSTGTLNLQLDTVSGGVASLNLAASGTYSIASNGRATLSYIAGGKTFNDVLYLDDLNDGYILGTGNTVDFGFFEAQAAGPFDNTTISGATFAGATWFPPVSTSPNTAAEITFSDPNITAGSLTGTYTVQPSGRGMATVNMPIFGSNDLVFYIIGAGSIEFMGSDNVTNDAITFLHF